MGAFEVRFEVVAGNAAGTFFLVEDELLIGRHAEGPGQLADDDEISRAHARVTVDQSGFCTIEDLGSTNGTFVNGLRITAPQTLAEGDSIELGATTLVVREMPDRAPPAPPVPSPQQATVTGKGALGPPAQEGFLTQDDLGPPTEEDLAPLTQESFGRPTPPGFGPPAEATLPPRLSLQLDVDFEAQEAWLSLDPASEPLRLVFDAGAWRAESSPATEKGPNHERRPDVA